MQDRIASRPSQTAWLLGAALVLAILIGLVFYVIGVRRGRAQDAASRIVGVGKLPQKPGELPPKPVPPGTIIVEEQPYVPQPRIHATTPPTDAPSEHRRKAPRQEGPTPRPVPAPSVLPARKPEKEPVRERANQTDLDRHEPAPESSREERAEPRTASEQDVLAVLRHYETTMADRDLNAHMSLYAPVLDRWFLKRRVSASAIRQQKQRDWQALSESSVDFRDVRVRFTAPGRAEVSFTKSWTLAGAQRWTGELRGTLGLRQTNGAWRIVSERDRQVLWQRRS